MGRLIEEKVNITDGITGDLRNGTGNGVVAGFKNYPDRLIARPDFTQDDVTFGVPGGVTTSDVIKASNGNIYALVVEDAVVTGFVLKSGSSNIYTDGWSTTYNANETLSPDSWIFEYKDYLISIDNGQDILTFGPLSGTPTVTNNILDIGDRTTLIGLIDYATPIFRKEARTWDLFDKNSIWELSGDPTDSASYVKVFEVGDNHEIVAAVDYENETVMALQALADSEENLIVSWDHEPGNTETTFTRSLGQSRPRVLGTPGYVLTCVCTRENEVDGGVELFVVQYRGGRFTEILGSTIPDFQLPVKFKYTQDSDKLYFPGQLSGDGTYNTQTFDSHDTKPGIFSVDQNGVIRQEHVIADLDNVFGIDYIKKIDASWIIGAGDEFYKTVDPAADTNNRQSGKVESPILMGGELTYDKELRRVRVNHNPLPNSATVSLYYRIVGESEWTLLTTNTDNDSIETEAVLADDGSELPVYNQIQIKVETTGQVTLLNAPYGIYVLSEMRDSNDLDV